MAVLAPTAALDILGLGPCYTVVEVGKKPGHRAMWEQAISGKSIDWQHLYRDYRSAVEWPTVSFLPEMLAVFPRAKVILTLREPEAWYESASSTIFPGLAVTSQHPDPVKRKNSAWKRKLILEDTFENKYKHKSHTIAI